MKDVHQLLFDVRDGLRRLDPAWCIVNGADQITDEELDLLVGEVEEICEELNERGRLQSVILEEAILGEREACALIAENGLLGHTIAKAIRARGEI